MNIGHNSQSGEHLRQYIERIERLEEEKANLAADIRDVFAEAKGTGFCTKTMKEIIRLRKKREDERQEEGHLLHTYMRALGMQPDLFEGGEDE